MNADERIAQNIRVLRKRTGISQETLAQQMREAGFKFHQQTIGSIEAGRRQISVGEAAELAAVFGVTLTDLANGAASQATTLETLIRKRIAAEILREAQSPRLDEGNH